jgi:hypothetical protein
MAMSSSFIYSENCDDYIRNASPNDQSQCVRATECIKNETTELSNTLGELKSVSEALNNALIKYANDVARCENYKDYSRKNPNIGRWRTLAIDCEQHYVDLGNKLVTAKRNLRTISSTERLQAQIGASKASLDYIKAKCNP